MNVVSGRYAATGAGPGNAAELAYAPASDRVVSISAEQPGDQDLGAALTSFDDAVRREVDLPGFGRVHDARLTGTIDRTDAVLAYREGVRARLILTGACPAAPGETVLATNAARALNLPVGQPFAFGSGELAHPIPLTVVGTFEPADTTEPYWGPAARSPDGSVLGERLEFGTMFTPLATLTQAHPRAVQARVDLIATATAVRDTDPQVLALRYEVAGSPARSSDSPRRQERR